MKQTTITLRCSPEEKLKMKIKANLSGMKLSAFIRYKTLKDETPQPTN